MAVAPYVLWGDQRQWPLAPPGFLFIVPAFNRIGRAIKGDAWDDQYPSFTFTPTPPASPLEASNEMREYAHYELTEAMGDDYHDDYVASPLTSLNDLGRVGSSLATIGNPQTGYRFTQKQWDSFRVIVRARNNSVRNFIAMTMAPAKWLYDMIASDQLSPFLLRRSGGNWHAGDPDDWKMPTLDQVRERVRQTTMTPGNASSTVGSHYIFFREDELEAALEGIRTATPDPAEQPPGLPAPENADARRKNAPPALAMNLVVCMLEDNPDVTRASVLEAINRDVGYMSERNVRGVMTAARKSLGLPAKGRPGARKKTPD